MVPSQEVSQNWGQEYVPNQDEIAVIKVLGFNDEQAVKAIKHAKGNMDVAADWLYSGAADFQVSTATPPTKCLENTYVRQSSPLNQLAITATQESEEEQFQRALAMSLESTNNVTASSASISTTPNLSTMRKSPIVVSTTADDAPWGTETTKSCISSSGWDTVANMGWKTNSFDPRCFGEKKQTRTVACSLAPCIEHPLLTGLIQALYGIPKVRYTLVNLPRNVLANKSGFELQNLFASMAFSDHKYLDPGAFISSLKLKTGMALQFKDLVRGLLEMVTSGGSTDFKE